MPPIKDETPSPEVSAQECEPPPLGLTLGALVIVPLCLLCNSAWLATIGLVCPA
jgi:hypothetical protein